MEALKNIKSNINYKVIEKSQNSQYKKYSIFVDLQDGSKQKSVCFSHRLQFFLHMHE